MKIHALPTGEAVLKHAFLHPRPGPRGRLDLFLPGPWADPLPIRAWLVEHGEHRILIDAGETAGSKPLPFSRHVVTPQDELPHALTAVGMSVDDITMAVLTHLHPDHYDGTVHVKVPVLVRDQEWAEATSIKGRIAQRLTAAPIPTGVTFQQIALDQGPFGAFEASRRLTDDGRVVAVSTPGHTPAHLSIVAIDDDGRHVLIAGDATDTLEQLLDRRADPVAPKPEIQRQTIDRIREHGRRHPTIYLPTHDPESTTRLADGVTL